MSYSGAIILGGISTLFSGVLVVYSFWRFMKEDDGLLYYIITVLSLLSFIYCINSLWSDICLYREVKNLTWRFYLIWG